MFITDLMEVGQIYLVLAQNWQDKKTIVTIKNGKDRPFDRVLIDSKLKVDTIYKYLLENWANGKLQIFLIDT